jgi:hypothetical protein
MRRLPLIFLLFATALRAADTPREIFPSDYTPSPCAVQTSCISFNDSAMVSAGSNFLAFRLDGNWAAQHGTEIKEAVAPFCRKHATCQGTANNSYTFCDDVLAAEARPVCEKLFPKGKDANDWEQCKMYLEVYLMGIDQNGINTWKTAQACVKKQPPATHAKPLDVWVVPASIPYEHKGYVTFYGIDPDTKVPILADVDFENQTMYAEANPAGRSATYYPMKLPFKYVRVPNKEGHTDAAPPMVTIHAPGYPPTSFRLPVPVPTAIAEMKPAALQPGKNVITVTARDSISGRAIDGRVMLGNDEAGFTNQPIAIEWKKGTKRPELWLKPYLNRYGDVVLEPAEK